MLSRRAFGWMLLFVSLVASELTSAATFPLTASANGRYLQDQSGTPFPILGRSYWGIIGLSPTNYQAALDDALVKGFNTIEFRAPNASRQDCCVPRDGAGNLPFTTKVGGGAYTGSFSETPDFTTPNAAYWTYLDTFIDYCASRGIVVMWFPAYMGYDSDSEGWGNVMVANGATRMRNFGAFVANRYKQRNNIIWLLGGDRGTGNNPMTSQEITVEQAYIDGLKSVGGQQSTQYAAEWASESIGTDQPNFASHMTLNGVYSWNGFTAEHARRGYADTPPLPTFLLEEPYDEEGADGTNRNNHATQPVRRFVWWSMLSGSNAGYMAGNGYLIHFFPGYASHFSSPGQGDLARLNLLWTSIPWHQLVPSGLAGMKTLVTAGGGGGVTATDYIAAAATSNGSTLLAYVPPTGTSSRSFTVDMTALSASARARWFNPTNGNYTDIASAIPNTGTRQFTTPGNNGTSANDWLLVVDTASGGGVTPSAPTNLIVD